MNFIKFIVVFLTFICNLNGQNTIFESNYSGVRVRSLPNLDSEVLYNLRKGKDVILLNEKSSNTSIVTLGGIEQTGYWQKVQVENTDIIGWVHEAALVPKTNKSNSYRNIEGTTNSTSSKNNKTNATASNQEENNPAKSAGGIIGLIVIILLYKWSRNRGTSYVVTYRKARWWE